MVFAALEEPDGSAAGLADIFCAENHMQRRGDIVSQQWYTAGSLATCIVPEGENIHEADRALRKAGKDEEWQHGDNAQSCHNNKFWCSSILLNNEQYRDGQQRNKRNDE